MRYSHIILTSLLLIFSAQSQAAFEAHEWGTFTSLIGSNGITQNGMYHEDEPLPEFVHPFGELRAELPVTSPRPPILSPRPPERPPCHSKICFGSDIFSQNIITQKMETPVIYFYSDHELNVDVNVRFPEGVVTDTYPGPIRTFPTQTDLETIANGDTTFSVKVLNTKVGSLPHVEPNNIYAHARKVDSNIVVSGAETEKFIFYRGIGRFQPQLKITSYKGNLNLKAPQNYLPQAAFLVHVDESGHGQMLNLGEFSADQNKSILVGAIEELKNHTSQRSNIVSGEQALGMLADSLISSGLKRDEALAMVKTWEHGYLKAPGLRLLYILPTNEVEQILPLQFSPSPKKLVRSFVGRIEVLLDTEEQRILKEILSAGSNFDIRVLGRFAEPILRRVSEVYSLRDATNVESVNLLGELVKRASVTDTGPTAIQ